MGFSPAQVGEMSLWQFEAAFHGWRAANVADEKPAAPTPEEHDELVAKYG